MARGEQTNRSLSVESNASQIKDPFAKLAEKINRKGWKKVNEGRKKMGLPPVEYKKGRTYF